MSRRFTIKVYGTPDVPGGEAPSEPLVHHAEGYTQLLIMLRALGSAIVFNGALDVDALGLDPRNEPGPTCGDPSAECWHREKPTS
jgi:hypothetical protein